jgi:hypothetical protein
VTCQDFSIGIPIPVKPGELPASYTVFELCLHESQFEKGWLMGIHINPKRSFGPRSETPLAGRSSMITLKEPVLTTGGNQMTYYVQAFRPSRQLDHSIGLYVEAPDYDAAYDLAVERDDIDIVRSVQRIAGGDQFA